MERKPKFFLKEHEYYFDRFIVKWCVSIFFIGIIVSILSIPIDGVWLFDTLSNLTPGINKWVQATNHRDMAKAIWIYMTYSSVFIFVKMILKIDKVNINYPFIFFIIIIPLTYFITVFFLFGTFLSEEIHLTSESNKRMLLYRETEIGCIFISCLVGASFISMVTMFLLAVMQQFNLRNYFLKI